jgi:hypothetical protein
VEVFCKITLDANSSNFIYYLSFIACILFGSFCHLCEFLIASVEFEISTLIE